ncbi:hypothetical protein [Bartonella sp. CB175]|uniref:hypothetical protein n=1 Tax=Bartonella sp. CB175 TaxID=3112256 RepID=UPI00300E0648
MTTTISSIDSIQVNQSKIFSHMVALIQDEIDDTTDEYPVQIQDSIFAALRFCKHEPLFFNEKGTITFKIRTGKTWYGQQDGLFIGEGKDIQSVFLGTNPATQTQLLYETFEVLQEKYQETSPQGTPLFYTCVDQKIGLFPTPKNMGTVCFSRTSERDNEENVIHENDPWMIYAFDLIKARAKYELYKNILKDPEYAAVAFNDFQEQLKLLRTETSRKKNSSKIMPVGF